MTVLHDLETEVLYLKELFRQQKLCKSAEDLQIISAEILGTKRLIKRLGGK